MAFSDTQMDKYMAHFKTKTNRRCPMCGGKKFELGYKALTKFKVNHMGGANVAQPKELGSRSICEL